MTDRSDWLAWRRSGLGGSDIAAILGISPYTSEWALWADKIGLVVDDYDNDAMEFGRWLELAVGPWFADRTGLHVAGEQMLCTHRHNPWARATLDGLVFDGPHHDATIDAALGQLEIKTDYFGRRWESIPEHYQAQGQWGMFVTGLPKVWFAVLHGRRLEVYELDRDEADIDFMVGRAREWWERHVVGGEPPAVDGSESTLRALTKAYPFSEPGERVSLSGDAAKAVEVLAEARAARREAEAMERAAKAVIANELGSAEIGTVDGEPVVTFRSQETHRIDLDRLRATHPRAAKRFEKTTSSRVMRLTTTQKETSDVRS